MLMTYPVRVRPAGGLGAGTADGSDQVGFGLFGATGSMLLAAFAFLWVIVPAVHHVRETAGNLSASAAVGVAVSLLQEDYDVDEGTWSGLTEDGLHAADRSVRRVSVSPGQVVVYFGPGGQSAWIAAYSPVPFGTFTARCYRRVLVGSSASSAVGVDSISSSGLWSATTGTDGVCRARPSSIDVPVVFAG